MTTLWRQLAKSVAEMWTAEDGNDLSDIIFARFMTFLLVALVCIGVVMFCVLVAVMIAHPSIFGCIACTFAVPLIVIKCLLNTAKKENEKEKHILVGSKEDGLQ